MRRYILAIMLAAFFCCTGFGWGGGGGTPIATTDRAGKVKPDGTTITITGDTISATGAISGEVSDLKPAADSTTAIQINKADGTTNVVNVDTTNSRVGIGTISPARKFVVNENNTGVYVSVRSSDTGTAGLLLGDQSSDSRSRVQYNNSTEVLSLWGNNLQRITVTGEAVGIGVASPLVETEIQSVNTNRGSRLYIIPNGNPATELKAGIKMFGTDYKADTTNYNDFGLWAGADYNHINSKHNGTGIAKDFVFSKDDDQYLAVIKMDGTNGFGTVTPASTLSIGTPVDATASYMQIDTLNADTAGPPAVGDCDASTEVGRMIVSSRYTATAEYRMWVCTQTGASTFAWKYTDLN